MQDHDERGDPEIADEFKVITHGVPKLQAALQDVKVRVDPEVGKALSKAGIPIKATAEGLALERLSGMRRARRGMSSGWGETDWSRMKIGRYRTVVYVAEKQHRQSGNASLARPNLAIELFNRALLPAARQHWPETEAIVAAQLEILCQRVNSI